MSLVDLPEDILLELCRRLVVSDLVNLLSTCRVMRNLQLQRTLWLDALTRIRTVEMYPLPPINPSDLSLPHLQQIARRASRLILNFESEKPLPVDIHTVAVGYGDEFIAIPGTHLVVVVEGLGIVSCWDVHTSRRVAYLELPGLRAQTGAPCMESEGKALIGACIGRGVKHLALICVDFTDRSCVSISHTLSRTTSNNYFFHSHLFLNSRTLGFCTKTSIVSWSLEADGEVNITPQDNCCPPSSPTPPCLLLGARVYMLHKRGLRTLAVYSVPLPPASPHEMDPATAPPRVIELPVPYPPLPNLDELLFLTGLSSRSYHADHICAPAYGVFAVTCVDLGNRKQSSSVVHFWLSGRINGGTLDDVGPSCVYGHPHLIEQMAVGSSGAYVVVLARAGEDAVPYLGLVHCRASGPLSPQITFRKLDVGDASLQDCHQLAFDDSLGLVLIAGSLGRLTAISYV